MVENTMNLLAGFPHRADIHARRGEWQLRAHCGSADFSLRALAARLMLQLRKFSCNFKARKVVIETNRSKEREQKDQVWLFAARCSLRNAVWTRVQGRRSNAMVLVLARC